MKIIRKRLKEMKFDETISFPLWLDFSIGRTWKTKRDIYAVTTTKDRRDEIKIFVVGQPRKGKYLIHKEFEFSEKGFEAAKKFALSGKEK